VLNCGLRKGVAFLRLGEQENCLAVHNADSCVFPLKPKAFICCRVEPARRVIVRILLQMSAEQKR